MSAALSDIEIDRTIDRLAEEDEEPFEAAKAWLVNLANEDFGAFGASVERALRRLPVGHPSLVELPWVAFDSDAADGDVVDLIVGLLRARDTGVVIVAMDVIVEIADPRLAVHLAPMQNDTRPVFLRGVRKVYDVGAYAKGSLDRLLVQNPNAKPLR